MSVTIYQGDCRDVLDLLPDASAQCCVTSPPYFKLRNYGVDGQIGREQSPDAYVAELVIVFREVWRVLTDSGCVFLNLGDSYAGASPPIGSGMKPKDLLMIPARAALALQSDGWLLRSDIIWHKPNPMPEPCRDRPTAAHEHVFLLSKQDRYFYDAAAIAEPAVSDHPSGNGFRRDARETYKDQDGARGSDRQWSGVGGTRNIRNVWTMPARPYRGAHFATMPPDLAARCILAGTKFGDTVLDPFAGAGTTGLVAECLSRNAILIELNSAYVDLARQRIEKEALW